jgi:hypothetical protein
VQSSGEWGDQEAPKPPHWPTAPPVLIGTTRDGGFASHLRLFDVTSGAVVP